ncbi:MAG: hypothetical protein N4A72_20295 [Bacteroidales bacterium]|jgi:hypothetical protein|nr:hypothetical protein [Bacteroidales bacterium]
MTTQVLDQKKTKVLREIVHEFTLKSEETFFITAVTDVQLKSASELSVREKTVKNADIGNDGAFVGVWKGMSRPNSMKEIVGQTRLSGSSSGGHWATKDIKITSPDVDLTFDTVTVGVFLRENDITSLAACIGVVAGQQIKPQKTMINVFSVTNRVIQTSYIVPDFVEPDNRRDYVMLFKGDQPVSDNRNPIAMVPIQSNQSKGFSTIDISNIKLEPGDYIIQYNASRYTFETLDAANVFTIR